MIRTIVALAGLPLHAESTRLRQQLHVQTEPAALPPTQYYGTVRVGEPAVSFKVVFDTGSGQLILPSSKCDDSACHAHTRFASNSSKTAMDIGWADDPTTPLQDGDDRDTKSLSVLHADVSGEFVRDNVCLGDQKGAMCATADFVVLTEESDDPFGKLDFDGVLGLAPSCADAVEFNLPQQLMKQEAKGVDRGIFALYLSPASLGSGGELQLGGYRQDRVVGELTWAPLLHNESWQVKVDDITIGGKATGLCGKTGCHAAIDTGSSLIMAPGNVLFNIVNALGFDDECTKSTPSLGFSVNGVHMELNQTDYLERDTDGCRLLLGSYTGSSGGPALVLGYPFLRQFYTVFDLKQKRIGFGRANHQAPAPTKAQEDSAFVHLVGVRP